MFRHWIGVALLGALVAPVISQSSQATRVASPLPPLLREVEQKYAEAKTLQAEFEQKAESAALQQTKVTRGLLKLRRPNQVRWETQEPDKSLLVSDGKTYWFYTPPFFEDERGQVMVTRTSKIQSPLANALLSGAFSVARDMKIDPIAPGRFALVPKKKSSGTVKRAEIEIDLKSGLIEKVKLEHQGGNRSEVVLSKIQLGVSIEPSEFSFKVPPNTDRVDPAKE